MERRANDKIINQMAVDQAVLLTKMGNVEKKVDEIDHKLNSDYATKEWCENQFGQTKKNVNMVIGLIITAVVLGVLKLIIIP